MNSDDDRLVLAEEPSIEEDQPVLPCWKVLIVDDEEEVHHITRLALGDFRFAGRKLEFFSAFSRAEAEASIARNPDFAIILLDVVMETDDAGLQFARFVRQTIGNQFVRVILRTGQPGMAPERQVMRVYDINDYRAKTELTQDRLYTVIQTALASYRDMVALARCRRQLVGVVDELDKLSEISSSQVRDPLKDILVTVQALLKDVENELSPEHMRALEKVKNLSSEVFSRVSDLLRLTETGSFNDARSLVNMNELVRDATEALQLEIAESGARIEVDDLPSVTGSRRQLYQLILNLLSNAISFSADSEPEIAISAVRRGDYWCFSVEDNGVGIPVEERQSVFSLFRRSGQKTTALGSGIGLNVCRKVVRWHGGEIGIEESSKGGACVAFTLPLSDS